LPKGGLFVFLPIKTAEGEKKKKDNPEGEGTWEKGKELPVWVTQGCPRKTCARRERNGGKLLLEPLSRVRFTFISSGQKKRRKRGCKGKSKREEGG